MTSPKSGWIVQSSSHPRGRWERVLDTQRLWDALKAFESIPILNGERKRILLEHSDGSTRLFMAEVSHQLPDEPPLPAFVLERTP